MDRGEIQRDLGPEGVTEEAGTIDAHLCQKVAHESCVVGRPPNPCRRRGLTEPGKVDRDHSERSADKHSITGMHRFDPAPPPMKDHDRIALPHVQHPGGLASSLQKVRLGHHGGEYARPVGRKRAGPSGGES